MQINFYLVEVNGLFSEIIVHVAMDTISRFRRDMPRINCLEYSRYSRVDFEYNILNKFRRQNVARSPIQIPSLAHYFYSCMIRVWFETSKGRNITRH